MPSCAQGIAPCGAAVDGWHRPCAHLLFKSTPTHTMLYFDPHLLSQSRDKKYKIRFECCSFSLVVFNQRNGKVFRDPKGTNPVLKGLRVGPVCPETLQEPSLWFPSMGRRWVALGGSVASGPQPCGTTNPTPQCHPPNHMVPPHQPQPRSATNPTSTMQYCQPNLNHAVPPTQPQPCGAFMPVSGHAVTPCQPHLLVSAPHPSFLSQCHTAPKSSSFCALSHPHKQCKQVKE